MSFWTTDPTGQNPPMQQQTVLPPIKSPTNPPSVVSVPGGVPMAAPIDPPLVILAGLQIGLNAAQPIIVSQGLHLSPSAPLFGVHQVQHPQVAASALVPVTVATVGQVNSIDDQHRRLQNVSSGQPPFVIRPKPQHLVPGAPGANSILQSGLQSTFAPAHRPPPAHLLGNLAPARRNHVGLFHHTATPSARTASDVAPPSFSATSSASAGAASGGSPPESPRGNSPPKKKNRSQTLEAAHAVEIFLLRPGLKPKTCSTRRLARELAKKYSVAPNTIRDIWNRRSWSRVTQEHWNELELKSAPGAITWTEQSSPAASNDSSGDE